MPMHDTGPEAGPDGPFGPPAIVCGTSAGRVSAGQGPGFVWIRVDAEPTGADLVGCIGQGREMGLLTRSEPVIVDLTGFRGVVDWSAIHAVRDMGAWGEGSGAAASTAKTRIAYVTKDRMFAALIRLVAGLFPQQRHRLFATCDEALAWLHGRPAARGRRS
jgi:hypothetical protein